MGLLFIFVFLYFMYYKYYIFPRNKLANDIFFLVNVSSPQCVCHAPRRTCLTEIGILPKFSVPQHSILMKTPRKQRSKTPDSTMRKRKKRNSSSGSKKRNKRKGNNNSASKNNVNNSNFRSKRSSTPPRIIIKNDSMWGDYIGKELNEKTIKLLKWMDPNTIDETEYYELLKYGNFVAVKRQGGRKIVVGRIESNYNGKPLKFWHHRDVSDWLNSRVNIRCFPSILTTLKGRGGRMLIDLMWLEKKLNEADFKTLELELYKSFEYELKKELKEPNSYFR
jgi:hypothetical protein